MSLTSHSRFSVRILAALLGFFLAAVARADVHYDMPKEELIKELGKPTSTLKHPGSGREVLNYPKGVRIEIEKGVVVSIKGLDMEAVEAATKAAVEKKAEAEAAAKLEQETQEKIKAVETAAAAKTAQTAPATKPVAAGETKAVTMEQAVAAMEKREAQAEHNQAREPREYDDPAEHFSLVKFLLGQVVWFALMLVALKLTTMYRDVDVEWSGIAIAAGADTGTRMVLALIAWFIFHTPTFFYLNQLIATGVMVLVLKKYSLNQTWKKAARVAFGVKAIMLVLRYAVEKVFHFAV